MSIPTPDFLLCPICRTRFNGTTKKPISLLCGHTCCSSCLQLMHRKQCPLDATPFQQEDIDSFPTNQALLLLVNTETRTEDTGTKPLQNGDSNGDSKIDEKVVGQCIGELALYLKPLSSGNQKTGNNITLSRPMQRKLVALVHCQLAEPVGRARALRAARSLGERTCTELILQHQNQQQLSSMLWAAVRTRGCQFLGPAMQEAALKYILLSLEQGEALSRKVLVLYVVQQLEPHFPQASKTSIGHVVQLLYRASCFKVAKRNDDSSLMQLKEEYRTYEALRREHDAQIVNMAQEAGIRIPPDQWSQLLYGDTAHKSHMQSIIDRLQTPASFTQSIQELMIALSRTEDTHNLSALALDFNTLAAINPATEDSSVTWSQLKDALLALRNVVKGLERFLTAKAKVKGLSDHAVSCLHDNCNAHGKYKTTMCRDLLLPQSCPRGASCTFAHTQDEMERYRNQKKKQLSEAEPSCIANGGTGVSSMPDEMPKFRPLSSSPAQQQMKLPVSTLHQGMPPPPPVSLAGAGMGGIPTSRPWSGDQRQKPSPRQIDPETLRLLQLKQQLLQQGVTAEQLLNQRFDGYFTPNVTNVDVARQRIDPQVPLWEQTPKVTSNGTPGWGDPLHGQLDEATLLRQELLRQYMSPALPPAPPAQLQNNYNNSLLANRLQQLKLLEHADPAQVSRIQTSNAASVQQLKYDLARAEGLQNMQRYEQLLGVSSALGANSGLGPNGTLGANSGLGPNGTLGGNHALAAHGLGGNGTLGAANNTALGNAALLSQLHPELAKTPHLLQNNTPGDPYQNAATPNIWQNDAAWQALLNSRPQSVAVNHLAPTPLGNHLGGSHLGGNHLGGNHLGGNYLGGNHLGGNHLGSNHLAGNQMGGNQVGLGAAGQLTSSHMSANSALGQGMGMNSHAGHIPLTSQNGGLSFGGMSNGIGGGLAGINTMAGSGFGAVGNGMGHPQYGNQGQDTAHMDLQQLIQRYDKSLALHLQLDDVE